MDFIAIDVETANWDCASICQVGLAVVSGGAVSEVKSVLVDPEEFFDPFNTEIHGITEDRVRGAPQFPAIHHALGNLFSNMVVVSHTAFDRAALRQASDKYGLTPLSYKWLDSARVVRRAWPDRYARRGYGLSSVAGDLGIEFQHHDAAEDARCAAEIVLRASQETGLDVEGWMSRVARPILTGAAGPSGSQVGREGNPEGPLFGEVLVFTGALQIPRREAADAAAQVGCKVDSGVTKHTTILVVGDQDESKLAGYQKSSKHRKADQLITKGQEIRVIDENGFVALTSMA